jgi:hypothetical protein
MSGAIVFTAVHMGPYQSIAPLEARVGVPAVWAVDGIARRSRAARGEPFADSNAIEQAGGAAAFLERADARAVVRSTSEDVDGVNLEDALAAGAASGDIAVVAVEDFPGNYRPVSGARLDVLCVETEATAALHRDRGVASETIHVTGNPRYDELRTIDTAVRRRAVREELGLGQEAVALWVGQPDAEDSFHTLEAILPALRAARATLLFRAHPRDTAYAKDRYTGLLAGAGLTVRDLTRVSDVNGLCCAADLVVTQFSSVAVEAGYLGTPALFVLLPGLGGAYIRKRKGYAIPPWCKEKCAFFLDDAKMAAVVVDGAMHDSDAREAVRANFARRYTTRPPSADTVAALITQLSQRMR